MKFLFAGGGTLGPVTPLLAVANEIRRIKPDAECVFVGTPDGPEARLVAEAGMRFLPLASPKLRRYFSLKTLALPFEFAASVWRAGDILKREKPAAVIGAGGYVQVPVGFAARLRGVKIIIHQQDVVPSLSNTLLAGSASIVTVAFEPSLADFPPGKAEVIGNPVRKSVEEGDRAKGLALLGVTGERPVVLAFGGGTGSVFLNELIASASPLWTGFADLAHITGLEKTPVRLPQLTHPERYHRFDFVGKDMAHLMAAADVVIGRAGMGTLTELAALAKPVILVPIPDSHQEKNAEYVVERGGARMFRELDLTPEQLVTFTRDLLKKPEDARRLGLGLQALFRHGAREALAEKVIGLVS
ncbi:MAG: UDP-N-acetylglucosamine--N-acetylmuramyl-(pentapeptide) pyrophosphoryl-undecaprenol N-acetylglucosamine transferase [Patescibacteria group bacterium]